jgi:hypothetical protein
MLVWRLRVLRPRHAGLRHWHRNLLVTPDNVRGVKRDLTRAGLQLVKLSELPARLPELVDVELQVRLTTRGNHRSCFILRRVGGASMPLPDQCRGGDADFPF